MIRPDIQAIAAKWIAELRLQDRLITVRYTTNLADPMGSLVYGLMTILNLDEGRFLIEVQDPSTWPSGGSRELSSEAIEEGIVHELVHVRWIDLTAHNPDPTALVQEERATWATARALIRANNSQRAAMVRAMFATQAASRRQAKGKSMDAKAVLAAIKDQDEAAALAILEQWLTEQIGGAAPPSVDDGTAPPMPAAASDDKGTPLQTLMRGMKSALDEARSAKAEIDECLKVARPAAKTEIVRGMRADGIVLTPHQEKLILDAPNLEKAKAVAEGMRAMAPVVPARKPAEPAGGSTAGLTRPQAAKYQQKLAAGDPNAESYRAACVAANTQIKKAVA
jgi:hypothetical protein